MKNKTLLTLSLLSLVLCGCDGPQSSIEVPVKVSVKLKYYSDSTFHTEISDYSSPLFANKTYYALIYVDSAENKIAGDVNVRLFANIDNTKGLNFNYMGNSTDNITINNNTDEQSTTISNMYFTLEKGTDFQLADDTPLEQIRHGFQFAIKTDGRLYDNKSEAIVQTAKFSYAFDSEMGTSVGMLHIDYYPKFTMELNGSKHLDLSKESIRFNKEKNQLEWNEVEKADEYNYTFNGKDAMKNEGKNYLSFEKLKGMGDKIYIWATTKKMDIGDSNVITVSYSFLHSPVVTCTTEQDENGRTEHVYTDISKVEEADFYLLYNGNEKIGEGLTDGKVDILPYLRSQTPGSFNLGIRARSNIEDVLDSDNSNIISAKLLDRPSITSNGVSISWSKVDSAAKYLIYEDGEYLTTTDKLFFDFPSDSYLHKFSVCAINDAPSSKGFIYVSSEMSNEIVNESM